MGTLRAEALRSSWYVVGEKSRKRGQMGKISATEASPAVAWGLGKGGGACRHALDAAVPGYQILVSCSDWSNVFMLTDSRRCWQCRALSMSRSYHYAPTKRVIKPPNQFIYARNACRVQLRLVLRERVNRNCTGEVEGSPLESIRLFFTGSRRCIFLWNVLIFLCRSWSYSCCLFFFPLTSLCTVSTICTPGTG